MAHTLLSMEKLIAEVQKQPCIWNVHYQSYSDKQLKMKAWQKICKVFYPQTVEHSADEINKITFIQKKWKSVRDYYTKQRKDKGDAVAGVKRRKYIYFDMLQFLEANSGFKIESRFDNSENSTREERNETTQDDSLDIPEDPQEELLVKAEETEDYISDTPEPEDHHSFHSPFNSRRQEIDEDEMFLLSLLPSIRKLTPLQKMDFKLEVMGALKRIQFSNSAQ